MNMLELLDLIDPVADNWMETEPAGHYTNTVSGRKIDATDLAQANIDQWNYNQQLAGKPTYIPGVTAIPDELTEFAWNEIAGTHPDGTPLDSEPDPEPEPELPPYEPNLPPPPGGTPPPGGVPGGFPLYGSLPPYEYMNTAAPPTGSGGQFFNPLPVAPTYGTPMTWASGPSGSSASNPLKTGLALPFTPFGKQAGLSTEILRYGGEPRSSTSGNWQGLQQAMSAALRDPAPAADPYALDYTYGQPGEVTYRPPSYQSPLDGGGYEYIVTDPNDGQTWVDPANGQKYVWGNGKWSKIDDESKPGPVIEGPPVVNKGGTGTPTNPFDLWIGGGTSGGNPL